MSQHKKKHLHIIFLSLSILFCNPIHAMQFVKELLSPSGSNTHTINSYDEWGQTPLLAAITHGGASSVASILEKGADPNMPSRKGDRVPLHAAVDHSNLSVLKLVISAKADLHIKDHLGRTALYKACCDWLYIVPTLIEAKANVSEKNSLGDTPLAYAIRANNRPLMQLLMTHHADVHTIDDNGDTLLHNAALCADDPGIIKELFMAKIDHLLKNKNNETAFEIIQKKNKKHMILGFIECGEDLNQLHPAWQKDADCRAARKTYENNLTLLLHATLTDTGYLIQSLTAIVLEYCYSPTQS